MGFTRLARSAGTRLASRATASIASATPPNTPGSRGEVSNNSGATNRPDASARPRPNTPQDEREDVPVARAQRDAHAHFVGALRHEIGHHAVESHRGDGKGENAHQAEHARAQSSRTDLRVEGLLKRLRVDVADGRVDCLEYLSRRGNKRRRSTASRTNEEARAAYSGLLSEWEIVVHRRFLAQPEAACVSDDAHDASARGCARPFARSGRNR